MTRSPTRRDAILASATVVAGLSSTAAAEESKRHVLILVGPTNHPPGTHEVAAGGRLMKHALEKAENVKGLTADVITEWPADPKTLADVKCVAFIGDLFPPAVMKDGERVMADLTAMTARGCGIVCVHYATGLEAKHVKEDGDHPLLNWTGGYFATRCNHHKSVAKVFARATIEPGKGDHPVLLGWSKFTVHDEPYINNWFGKDGPAKNVTLLATSQLPPEKPTAETVAWATERKDGGRGVGVVMPHFYRNWKQDDLRTLILNGIVWAAGAEVPKAGVRVILPDLTEFKPAAVEPVKK